MSGWMSTANRRATPAAYPRTAAGTMSPRARLTRRLFIDLRRSAGSLCH
ncbi:hypothetical protein EHYA_00074 [Embleya hyalina]|uniref:Uncharacterized protein n=1 Tax=Embleya hyalina TaxID=516124 RepID=A0A401YCY7_9ACTN|nr:hypothetical protein EHYA_00074 [Embleya hyalina]